MSQKKKNAQILGLIVSVVFLMGALAYASVPLYRLFCQVTGFGGTTQQAESIPDKIYDRVINVRFNADINTKLPWSFKPTEVAMDINVGQTGLTFYEAANTSDTPVVGTATYNVTPHKAGQYFHKVQCFCFEEQLLKPGEGINMPVQFYIDPEILSDPNLDDVHTITLSYTFFKAQSQELAEALKFDAPEVN